MSYKESNGNLKVFFWAINQSRDLMENLCKYSLKTAELFGIEVELLGIGHQFKEHKQRLDILYKRLARMDRNTIILCMDGSDTLIADYAHNIVDIFLRKNVKILVSGEKGYTWQAEHYKSKFELITEPYKYVNAGTFIGYAGDLIDMLKEIFELDKDYKSLNDQGLLGLWVHKNIEDSHKVQVDSNSELFWVTTSDWFKLKEIAEKRGTIFNGDTHTKPIIIHCVGIGDKSLNKCYMSAYNSVLHQSTVEHFRIAALSERINDKSHSLFRPKHEEYDTNRLIWDERDHPNIISFFYGRTLVEEKDDVSFLPTPDVSSSIFLLNQTYHLDYIVHVPKGFFFQPDELYHHIRTRYNKEQIKEISSFEFPQSESFIYFQGRYYPFDGLKNSEEVSGQFIATYEKNRKENTKVNVLKEYKAHSPDFPIDVISLGGWCGPAIASNTLGTRIQAYPFCMIHTRVECIREIINGNKDVLFMDKEMSLMPHHNMDDPEEKQKMDRRLEKFIKRLSDPKPILFIRTIINPDTDQGIANMLDLSQEISQKYQRMDRYVFVLHDQKINTVKLARPRKNVMIWAVDGDVGWNIPNRNLIFSSYCRLIRYCLDEHNWEYDNNHVKFHSTKGHRSWHICKSLYFDKKFS